MRGTLFIMPTNPTESRPHYTPYPRPNPNGGAVNDPNHYYSDWEHLWLGQADESVDDDAVTSAWYPNRQQYSEWAQQMVSQMYQNYWNSAPEQMRRAMEAGINPYLAANGIAGNGTSSSQPAPPSSVGAGASGLNSIASTLGTLGSIASQGISGFAMLKKLRPEIDKITAETSNLFESMGFTKLQSKALSIQLKYMDEKESIGVWQALANFNRTKQEYSNLKATHRNILAQFDEIIAQKDLLIAEKGEVEARKILNQAMSDKERAIAQWYNDENKFFEQHHFRSGDSIYESIRNMMVEDGTFNPETFGDVVAGYDGKVQGAVEEARQNAISNHAYSIELGRQSGKNAADELYGRIGSPADLAGRIAKMGSNLITNSVDKIGNKLDKHFGSPANLAQNLFKSGDAKKIRAELRMVLDNAYDQLDKHPEDADRLKSLINDIQGALSLSNKELSEWYKKQNQ